MEIGRCLNMILLLLLVWHSSPTLSQDVEVETPLGTVRGTQVTFNNSQVNQYLGVPFAKPPVGDLRFKRTQPAEPFSETLVADTMPPACIQYLEVPFPWYDFQDGKSEDCLYLNIWAPGDNPQGLPVLFWIYGGGFTVGSNRKRIYEGQALAARGKVVVVTINYRMGVFGFLTSATEEAPGNYGMYDMVEALKWVNQNIAAFGGDPNKVTLVGQSAGSIAIGLLCVSPLTKGLFHRVIMESGSPAYTLADNSVSDNVKTSQKLAKAVGCADDSNKISDDPEAVVSCLKEKDAMELAKTLNSFHPTSARSFFPQYGDEVLPRNAREELIDGNFHNADVLIGNNHDEGAFQITTAHPDVFGFFGQKDTKFNKTYGVKLLNGTFSTFPDPEAVYDHYLGGVDDDDYDLIRYQVYTAMGDYSLLCPTVYFAESYSRAGNDVHYYFFTHRPSTTPWAKWMGVVHYEEVQFVFGLPLQERRNYTDAEVALSGRIIDIWTTFVREGSTGVRSWRSYSREKPVYLKLNTYRKKKFGHGPHKDNCDFFRGYYGFP